MIFAAIFGIFAIAVGLLFRRDGLRSFAVLGSGVVVGQIPRLAAVTSDSGRIALSNLSMALSIASIVVLVIDIRRLRRERPGHPTMLSRLVGYWSR